MRLFPVCNAIGQVLAKLKSITHELDSPELDKAARNLQVEERKIEVGGADGKIVDGGRYVCPWTGVGEGGSEFWGLGLG